MNDYDSVDTQTLIKALDRAQLPHDDAYGWLINYAKRLDAATNGEAEALLTITDHLGWTDVNDKDVDVVALIAERTTEA